MAQDWYVMMRGKQVGPLTPQQLRDLATSGQLQPTDTVWKEGMANWQPASSVKGLPVGGAPSPITAQAPTYPAQSPMAPTYPQQGMGAPAWPQQGIGSVTTREAYISKNFRFDGSAGDFFVVYLLMTLLTMFTCGIGFPWAMCMFARWFAEHCTIQGRRLKFTGTGGELFGQILLGYLLCIVTFSIYMFWFVPKIYRWIVEHTDFADA
jgi:uncharacterized membrane protein YjgN (DUF898 family)